LRFLGKNDISYGIFLKGRMKMVDDNTVNSNFLSDDQKCYLQALYSMPYIIRQISDYIKKTKTFSLDSQQTLDAIWGLVVDFVNAEINNKNNYTIGLKKREFFKELTDDFRNMVATVVTDEINTSRRILPVHFDSSVVIEKNLGLIVYAFANVQQSDVGPSSEMSWSELFCVKMIELASNCAFQENSQVDRTDLEKTSDFIEAILKQQENQNVPQKFSALLPEGIDPKQFRVIWEKLLTEQNGMNRVIMGLMDSLQTSKRDMLRFVSKDFLPELVDFISGAVTVAANNVALNKVLPELKTSELARKLVVQHLSAQGDGDDNKIFLLKSLLGVPKEKEAKDNLRKQTLDPLAVDKVVDYFVADFASSLDTFQESGRNIVEWQIAGIRRQIDLSIKGVHEELQQQAADKAQKEEFYKLCTTARATLDECIRNCLPSSFDDKPQTPNWNKVNLTDKVYKELIEYLPSEHLSGEEKKHVIREALQESRDVLEVLYDFSPFLRNGKRFNGATPEEQKRYIKKMLNINDENLSDIIAAATACAQLRKTPEEYYSMMQNQAANTQNH
jgi:hypothetical protein